MLFYDYDLNYVNQISRPQNIDVINAVCFEWNDVLTRMVVLFKVF